MASVQPQRAPSLAQSLHDELEMLNGALTWEEAIVNIDGMKIVVVEKPIIVNRPTGSIRIGDLPAKDKITHSIYKKESPVLRRHTRL